MTRPEIDETISTQNDVSLDIAIAESMDKGNATTRPSPTETGVAENTNILQFLKRLGTLNRAPRAWQSIETSKAQRGCYRNAHC